MGLRRHYLWIAALSTLAIAISPSVAGSNTSPTVETVSSGPYGFAWSPKEAHTGLGVTFTNKTPGVPHGIIWTGGAGEPKCAGTVPIGSGNWSSTEWSGECTFSQPGVYSYECSYHLSAMTGTVVVPGTPKASTAAASGEDQTEATLKGSIEPQGNAIEYHFQYGTSSVSEHTTPASSLGATDFASHPVSTSLTGLMPSKIYRFQLIAAYGGGTTVLGGEQTFTTPAPTAPTVTTSAAIVKGEHEATLKGTVDPNGGEATEYFFEYATAAEYEVAHSYGTQTLPVAGLLADNAQHAASTVAQELQAGTTYHFRLVARNKAGGPSYGEDRTFKTASPPSPKEEPPPPPANPTPTPTSGPISPQPALAPLVPPLVQGSLKLAAVQRGAKVSGSLDVSQSGAGGRLEVDLIAKSASLARRGHHSRQVTVGRLVRASVSAGRVSFSVGLNARARSALRRHHGLALMVKVTVTPPAGEAVTLTRKVAVRA